MILCLSSYVNDFAHDLLFFFGTMRILLHFSFLHTP